MDYTLIFLPSQLHQAVQQEEIHFDCCALYTFELFQIPENI
jgi:hypothetical protein